MSIEWWKHDRGQVLDVVRTVKNQVHHEAFVVCGGVNDSNNAGLNRTHLIHLEDKEKDEGLNWERGADVMPTGRVVGVMQRIWGDYIATLPREEEDSMEKAAGKRILVYPYNRKIPKSTVENS